MKAEDYSDRRQALGDWQVHIVSYRLGDRWYCQVDNVDPGAQVARAEGATREEAEGEALAKAERRLGRTRVHEG